MRFLLIALIFLSGCKTTTSYYYNKDGIIGEKGIQFTLPIARIVSNTETEATMILPDGHKFTHNAKSQSTVSKLAEAAKATAIAKALTK